MKDCEIKYKHRSVRIIDSATLTVACVVLLRDWDVSGTYILNSLCHNSDSKQGHFYALIYLKAVEELLYPTFSEFSFQYNHIYWQGRLQPWCGAEARAHHNNWSSEYNRMFYYVHSIEAVNIIRHTIILTSNVLLCTQQRSRKRLLRWQWISYRTKSRWICCSSCYPDAVAIDDSISSISSISTSFSINISISISTSISEPTQMHNARTLFLHPSSNSKGLNGVK